MSHKIKSALYFTCFVLVAVTYYNIGNEDIIRNTELAENTIEEVSTIKTLD